LTAVRGRRFLTTEDTEITEKKRKREDNKREGFAFSFLLGLCLPSVSSVLSVVSYVFPRWRVGL
jgi:hypothetical protein